MQLQPPARQRRVAYPTAVAVMGRLKQLRARLALVRRVKRA